MRAGFTRLDDMPLVSSSTYASSAGVTRAGAAGMIARDQPMVSSDYSGSGDGAGAGAGGGGAAGIIARDQPMVSGAGAGAGAGALAGGTGAAMWDIGERLGIGIEPGMAEAAAASLPSDPLDSDYMRTEYAELHSLRQEEAGARVNHARALN